MTADRASTVPGYATPCAADGCGSLVGDKGAKGLCPHHYNRLRNTGSLEDQRYRQPSVCTVEKCSNRPHSKGLCPRHYEYTRKHGRLEPEPVDIETSFWSKVDFTGECWVWVGPRKAMDYGDARLQGRRALAHRVAYYWLVGDIPPGLHLDHLCRNPPCVNPFHLEPVTASENAQRGLNGRLKTHCNSGHPLSGENLVIRQRHKAQGGWRAFRTCRTCERTRSWRRRHDIEK